MYIDINHTDSSKRERTKMNKGKFKFIKFQGSKSTSYSKVRDAMGT